MLLEQERRDHDVIVIGGGVNGTGVARDAAIRGFRVALFEKNDLAFGASGNNSGMIHGGPRYLMSQPEVTEQSCRDSGYIQRIAPHLLFRIPFIFPVEDDRRGARAVLAAVDAFFACYDRYQPLKRGKRHALLDPSELARLEPGLRGKYVGAVTFDEWGIDGARLSAANALDARERGAEVRVHTEVYGLLIAEGEGRQRDVIGVRARDLLTGDVFERTASVVVNATGAWAPVTAGLVPGTKLELRPGKGIHVVYDRRLSNYAIVTRAIDGRQVFLMPWENLSWIGTTDDDFYGDLDRPRATTDEARYLIEAVERLFPSTRSARVIGTTVGVRPTIYGYGMYEDELSREHEIVDHAAVEQLRGLYSMVGGKLASYRIFAEEMTDIVAAALGSDQRGQTHRVPLPGGDATIESSELARASQLPEPAVRRLVYRHGTRALRVLERCRRDPREGAVVCPCEPVMECEVRYVCREELARTLDDVTRRTRLGLGACGGMHCAFRAAQIVADEHGYSPAEAHRMSSVLLRERFESRVVALDAGEIRQEELLGAVLAYGGGRSIAHETEP